VVTRVRDESGGNVKGFDEIIRTSRARQLSSETGCKPSIQAGSILEKKFKKIRGYPYNHCDDNLRLKVKTSSKDGCAAQEDNKHGDQMN